jgi:hypothetical protein
MEDHSEEPQADSGETSPPARDSERSDAVLSVDHVYQALGHPRRRYLCYTLLEGTAWSLDELAQKVAAWENDVPESAVTERQQERAYVSLYHAHVPKLVEEGVVTFDEETETITVGPNADQALAALEGVGASLDAGQESHAREETDGGE